MNDSTKIEAVLDAGATGAVLRRLTEVADNPAAFAVPVRAGAWGARWPFGEVQASVRQFDLAELARRRDWPRLLCGTWIRGHGTVGYGPHRLAAVLADEALGDKLEHAVTVLAEDGPDAAYEALFRGPSRVRGLGPSAFTRFLACAQPVVDPVPACRALVLDRWIARTLRWATEEALGPHGSEPARRWWSDPWPTARYRSYLGWAAATAAITDLHLEDVEHAAFLVGRELLTAAA